MDKKTKVFHFAEIYQIGGYFFSDSQLTNAGTYFSRNVNLLVLAGFSLPQTKIGLKRKINATF